MSEIAEGIKPDKPPEKPEALVLYEQINTMGTPLVAGGIKDQPYIWMMEYKVCDDEAALRKARQEALRNSRKQE